jgi:hypothetical protein
MYVYSARFVCVHARVPYMCVRFFVFESLIQPDVCAFLCVFVCLSPKSSPVCVRFCVFLCVRVPNPARCVCVFVRFLCV